MIQIYAPDNVNYEKNGDVVLLPEICDVEAELGGTWFLSLTHPIDEANRWEHIVKESVVSAPTFMGKNQLFRVDEIDKQDKEITAKAYPVFLDSADDHFLFDVRPTEKTGQQALDIMTAGSIYSGVSDIKDIKTAYFIRRNLVDALGGDSPSFIGTWGGEPLYDNHKVVLNKRAGGDYGAEVRYGKNMNGISFREDMSNVVTRIVPVAFNGRMHSKKYVDSPLVDQYAKIYTKEIKFENIKLKKDLTDGEDTNDIIVCNNQEELNKALVRACNEQ